MEPKRPERVLLVTALLIVGLLSAGYVIGYFALPTKSGDIMGIRVRQFEHKWQTTIYYPASRIESHIIRRRVWLEYPAGINNFVNVVE